MDWRGKKIASQDDDDPKKRGQKDFELLISAT